MTLFFSVTDRPLDLGDVIYAARMSEVSAIAVLVQNRANLLLPGSHGFVSDRNPTKSAI
jgi:hypothetical protein